jgi:Protein of unknown function (DUF4038)/Putative collagen-binding domain of a collagenase
MTRLNCRSCNVFFLLLAGTVAWAGLAKLYAASPTGSAPPVFPLKVSANKHYLVDQNNVPFLIVGDTPQGLIGRLTEHDAEIYFTDREAFGFNTAGWIDVTCAGPDYPDNVNAATPDGMRPFSGFVPGGIDHKHYDLSKPNEAYFSRLDHIVQIAADHHQAVFLDPMETIGWLPTLRNNGVQAAYAYGQYLGRRYKRFANVLWLNGNDFNTWKDSTDDALVQAVAKGIRSLDPDHLQTVELNVHTSSSFDDPTWIPLSDLNSTYTYSPTYIQMLHSYNQKPVAPTYLVEAHYDLENVGKPPDYGTPYVLRREEYWTMLTGGTGQFYGNAYTWSFKAGWQSHLDTPGAAQLKLWKDFFTALPWQDLVPDQDHSILTAGFGSYGTLQTRVSESDYATAAATSDGRLLVIYMPTARTITINTGNLRSSARARWFDPTNGAYQDIFGSPFVNSGSHRLTPPGKNHDSDSDWVLLLDAR